jgi:ABC-type multidrug transport system fused ATPase/permease subunit
LKEDKIQQEDQKKIVVAEDRAVGSIGWNVIASIFRFSGGVSFALLFILFMILGQVLLFSVYFWLNSWAAESQLEQNRHRDRNLAIFAGLVLATLIVSMSAAILYFLMMIKIAKNLHNEMLSKVLYSPLRFFEANPLGRILNRFSRDQAAVDEILPLTSFDFIRSSVWCLGSTILVMVGNPWVLLSLLVIVPLFLSIRNRYVKCSREIKRLDGISKSPVFELFSSVLEGLVSVRAYSSQERFKTEFDARTDYNNRAWFAFMSLARWIGFRMDYIVAAIISAAALIAVITRNSIDPEVVALSLTYILQMTGVFQWAVRQSAETENLMTSYERVYSYTTLPPEDELGDQAMHVDSDWPRTGELKFADVRIRYRPELDDVLKGVTLDIRDKEKVGVCGRTGSGKSTLFKSCFRIIPITSGNIFLDGIDISKISLDDLRSRLSIIPQDPVIFSGTLRYNLDPLDHYSDQDILQILSVLNLSELLSRLPDGLDTVVAESGTNFSAGEGQLICVARALLRPSRLLFVDEATANVDKATDQLIQKVLREHFKDRTVMTIAHRLDTIVDSDKIVVMDKGIVAESGPASALMSKEDGIFYSMARDANFKVDAGSPSSSAS